MWPTADRQNIKVKVHYSTTPQCTAVGWLEPAQTKSGQYPYLYSQSQAIHGRSMLPCQDTPAVKATYSANVKGELPVLMSALRQSPKPEEKWVPGKVVEYVYDQVGDSYLGCREPSVGFHIYTGSASTRLLIASRQSGFGECGMYRADEQPVAIPSYLIAIASGELVYKPFEQLEGKNWKSGCWTEPKMMDAAFWEFHKDTAK
jgi:leukotriene-A4 hydrolase